MSQVDSQIQIKFISIQLVISYHHYQKLSRDLLIRHLEIQYKRLFILGQFKRGEAPLFLYPSPSPFKERGIKGVRLIDSPQLLLYRRGAKQANKALQ